jgi:hypothetical protein
MPGDKCYLALWHCAENLRHVNIWHDGNVLKTNVSNV